jgi:hypothetical protein
MSNNVIVKTKEIKMKKSCFLLVAVLIILTGCSGIQLGGSSDVATQVLVSIATRNIACSLSTGDPNVIRSLENIYVSMKTGTLSDDALAQLSELTMDRPTLAADVQDLIILLGVRIDPLNNDVLGLDMMNVEMFTTIERAWNQGIVMCSGSVI